MWKLHSTTGLTRLLMTALYVGAVVLFVYLQEIGLKLRRAEQRAWWAGTGRDFLNAAGFTVIAWTLHLSGFPSAAAVLVAGTLTLILFGAYVYMDTQTETAWPRTWALVIGLAVTLPVLLWPNQILWVAALAVAKLFPGVVP